MTARRALAVLAPATLAALALAAPVRGSDPDHDRGDLGRALRRFEVAWDASRESLSPERRDAVVGRLERATFAFFSGQTGSACKDLAWATGELGLGPREAVTLHAPAIVASGAVVAPAVRGPARAAILRGRSEVEPGLQLEPGRYEVVLQAGECVLERRPLAVVADLAGRVARLDAALAGLRGLPRSPSLEARRARLGRALDGKDDGVDRDQLAELETLEADAAALARGQDPFAGRPGDELRAIRREDELVPYRLAVPARPTGDVVLALHGVGGDEDMLAEALGRGIVRRLALEAGAIFVAPRSVGPTSGAALEVLDAVARDYKVERVFVLGHSMGAMEAVDLLRREPARFKAAALFAGPGLGAAVPKDCPPFYATCGEKDFALGGAEAFAQKATKKGVAATWDPRPGIEHVLIVREAAPAAFAFFRERGLGGRRYY